MFICVYVLNVYFYICACMFVRAYACVCMCPMLACAFVCICDSNVCGRVCACPYVFLMCAVIFCESGAVLTELNFAYSSIQTTKFTLTRPLHLLRHEALGGSVDVYQLVLGQRCDREAEHLTLPFSHYRLRARVSVDGVEINGDQPDALHLIRAEKEALEYRPLINSL